MNDIASILAPVATMIAAMMTAANLGARVTGWGFVVFTAGSIAWSVVGITTGQTNLLISNGFLTLVNVVGIWRWLGRQAKYEEGARSASAASSRASVSTLFTASGIAGMAVDDEEGAQVGRAVEALIECRNGAISYLVISSGGLAGIDEELRAVPQDRLRFERDRIRLSMPGSAFLALPVLGAGDWPASANAIESV